MIVICTNDYPFSVLPDGTTQEQAQAEVDRLNGLDQKYLPAGRRVHYRWHDIPVVAPGEAKLWGRHNVTPTLREQLEQEGG